MILERLVIEPFGTNCYIVGDESSKDGIIIDPGAEATRILNRVKELELKIKFIVLTHAHPDHIGALKEVKEATKAEVAMHADETFAFETRHSFRDTMSPFSIQALSPPDRLLKDGDSIDIGDLHFVVRHTPGHTPGGICLLGEGIVFSGDTLFNLSVGRTDMSGGSHRQLINGIHGKLMVLPDDTFVFPGHGPETTIGNERQYNPFLR